MDLAERPEGRTQSYHRLVRWLFVSVVASGIVAAALVVVTDAASVTRALRGFDPRALAAMLALGLLGFVLRGLRWGWLLRLLGHPLPAGDALYLQLAGQTMSVTPGRVGEVLKPVLSREVAGVPMSTGLPLVFTERVADLIAVCLLALGGLSAIGGTPWVLGAAIAALVAGTWLASSSWFHRFALRSIGKQGWAARHRESAEAISEAIRLTLDWRALAWSVPVSVAAWGLEGLGFALCLRELGFTGLPLVADVSVYAVATIAGAFSFLPGGIGLTEASMAGILSAAGMAPSAAAAGTLITRVATLWWGVGLGWIALASRPHLLRAVLGTDGGTA